MENPREIRCRIPAESADHRCTLHRFFLCVPGQLLEIGNYGICIVKTRKLALQTRLQGNKLSGIGDIVAADNGRNLSDPTFNLLKLGNRIRRIDRSERFKGIRDIRQLNIQFFETIDKRGILRQTVGNIR